MGDLPPNTGGERPGGPLPGQWPPIYPPQVEKPQRGWPAVALAAIAVLLGIAALVVAFARSSNHSGAATTPAASAFTAEEAAAAHKKLCDMYNQEARAVQITTNGDNPAYAGIATVNGAVILQQVVSSAPALPPGDRAAALALAEAYSNAQVLASLVQRDDPAWRSAADNVNAKDAAMQKICGTT